MIRIAHVLCPVDFSEISQHALAHAAAVARWYKARLTVLHVFANLPAVARPGTVLAVYGPFRYGGRYTSPSNESFDAMLRARDPESGIRDFEAVDALAREAGFGLRRDHAMPANNQTIVWQSG